MYSLFFCSVYVRRTYFGEICQLESFLKSGADDQESPHREVQMDLRHTRRKSTHPLDTHTRADFFPRS